jgi:hypothetical protein
VSQNTKVGFIVAGVLALIVAGSFGLRYHRRAPALGAYEKAARMLSSRQEGEVCDRAGAERRIKLSRLLDQLRPRIVGLWQTRVPKDFPKARMEQVGPIFLRLSDPEPQKKVMDISSWSWEEAESVLLRTQADPGAPETKERWRDFDTMVRFLLEKDVGRLVYHRAYFPPQDTPHHFAPRKGVERTGQKELTVTLSAGDFEGAEKSLTALLEKAWSRAGWRLKVKWGSGAYQLKANFNSSRSFVDHRKQLLVLANYTFTRTVAHELGHVLGFDDHYYSVWHKENCYYTQESDLSDLMSNSEKGAVGESLWKVLDQAYPWRLAPAAEFVYKMPQG